MMTDGHPTQLHPALVEAYRNTRYRVFAERPFELTVDHHSAPLAALMRDAGVAGAAFVTAWNPLGDEQGLELNRRRQDALRGELRAQGLRFIEGFGAHAGDPSRGEESLLVLGLARDEACALGRRLAQNAILWSDRDAVPRLALLR